MIKLNKYISFTLLLVIATFSLPASVLAEQSSSTASPLFKFQHKLANKGNVRAQYKLAGMYETGKGIALDLQEAKLWYEKASKNGMKAATDRNIYLIVKQQGFNQTIHSIWLDGVKADAKARNVDATFLLGQLYREGLGVKKDLNRSLALFEQVSSTGDADIEDEIVLIQTEIDDNNKLRIAANNQRRIKAAKLAAAEKAHTSKPIEAKVESPVAVAAIAPVGIKQALILPKDAQTKQQQIQQQAEAEKINQEQKIRNYKKAMMQLKREQQEIDKQQAWATGDAQGIADDEI